MLICAEIARSLDLQIGTVGAYNLAIQVDPVDRFIGSQGPLRAFPEAVWTDHMFADTVNAAVLEHFDARPRISRQPIGIGTEDEAGQGVLIAPEVVPGMATYFAQAHAAPESQINRWAQTPCPPNTV